MQGNALPDHVHPLLSVPPKYSIAMTIGYLKGNSAVRIHRQFMKTKGTLFGRAFWSRGYCVSTVGLDEAKIRRYIEDQKKGERDEEHGLFGQPKNHQHGSFQGPSSYHRPCRWSLIIEATCYLDSRETLQRCGRFDLWQRASPPQSPEHISDGLSTWRRKTNIKKTQTKPGTHQGLARAF